MHVAEMHMDTKNFDRSVGDLASSLGDTTRRGEARRLGPEMGPADRESAADPRVPVRGFAANVGRPGDAKLVANGAAPSRAGVWVGLVWLTWVVAGRHLTAPQAAAADG